MTPEAALAAADGLVRLRVPADTGYARVVRVAVSAYAVRLGANPRVVQDLRLAVDEALILLLAARHEREEGDEGDGPGAELVLVLHVDPATDRLTVELHVHPTPSTPATPDALARFHELIPTGVDTEVVDPGAGRVLLRHPTTPPTDEPTGA